MDWIRWLYDLQHLGIKLGLENVRSLLRLLDHPESNFPSILVAGTNGKGSVASMIHSMLEASGIGTGLFTSPHLIRPNERIRIGQHDIDDTELARILGLVRETISAALARGDLEVHPSFFEVITATALVAFRDRGVKAAVLEVGLGGRLDATNAVEAEVAVVVSIDLDHTKTLGTTLARIAGEKAGIAKRGRPLVSGAVQQQAIDVIKRTCRERGSRWIDARLAARLVADDTRSFTLVTSQRRYPDLSPSLSGRHQIDNARVALAAFECFADQNSLVPDPAAVRRGLGSVRWPGRLHWIPPSDTRPRLLLDGAHNPAGARTLANYLESLDEPPPVAVMGAMTGKILPPMFEALGRHLHTLIVTRPSVDRSEDPHVVASLARSHVARVEVVAEPRLAIERAFEVSGGERFVLVTGSLYLVGEVLSMLTDPAAAGPVSM